MKIFSINYWADYGGAGILANDLNAWLAKKVLQVDFFVAKKKFAHSQSTIIKQNKFINLVSFIFNTNVFINTDYLLKEKAFLDCDIVHVHNLQGRYFNLKTLVAMSKLKPVVWTMHDEWPITENCANSLNSQKLNNGLYVCPGSSQLKQVLSITKFSSKNDQYIYLRELYKLALGSKLSALEKKRAYDNFKNMTIATPSDWLKDRVEKSCLGKLSVKRIYNGVDTNVFCLQDKIVMRQALNLPLDKKIIILVAEGGEKNVWKGWRFFASLAEKNKNRADLMFICLGGSKKERDEFGVYHVGYGGAKENVAKYLSACDVMLYPSLADSFGLVVAEGLACGLPVVAFATGGIPELINHQIDGYLAKYLDTADLEQGLNWALALNKTALVELSAKASLKIKDKFSQEQMFRQYLDLYQKIKQN